MLKVNEKIKKFSSYLNNRKVFIAIVLAATIIGFFSIPLWNSVFSLLSFALLALYMLLSTGKNNLLILCYIFGMSFIIANLGEGISYISLLFIVYIAKCILNSLFERKPMFIRTNGIVPFIFFALYLLIIAIINIQQISILSQVSFLIYSAFPIFVLNDERCVKDVDKILITMIASMLISSTIAVVFSIMPGIKTNYFMFVDPLNYEVTMANFKLFDSRFSGMFLDQNEFALYSASCSYAYILFMLKKKYAKWPILLIVPLVLITSLSQSKSFLLVSFVFFIFLAFIYAKKKPYSALIGSLAVLLLGTYVFITLNSFLMESVLGRFFEGNGDLLSTVTTGRTNIWITYITFFDSHPSHFLFGMGAKASYNFDLLSESSGLLISSVNHNYYLNLVFDFGFIGSLLYISYLLHLFGITVEKSDMDSPPAFLNFAPLLLFLIFAFGLTLTNSIIQYYVFMYTALFIYEKERKKPFLINTISV